jgi:hypothetical protein
MQVVHRYYLSFVVNLSAGNPMGAKPPFLNRLLHLILPP